MASRSRRKAAKRRFSPEALAKWGEAGENAPRSHAQKFVALDICCQGGPDGPVHTSHRIWRFTAWTHAEAPPPDRWSDKDVSVVVNSYGEVPEPFGDEQLARDWTAPDGSVWVPMDCVVCDPVRQLERPLSWVRELLADAWERDTRKTLRVVL